MCCYLCNWSQWSGHRNRKQRFASPFWRSQHPLWSSRSDLIAWRHQVWNSTTSLTVVIMFATFAMTLIGLLMKVTYTLISVSSIVFFTCFVADLISLACVKYEITAVVTQAVGKNAFCDADSYRCVKDSCYRQHEEIYWRPLCTANRVRSSICVHYDPLMDEVDIIQHNHIFECLTLVVMIDLNLFYLQVALWRFRCGNRSSHITFCDQDIVPARPAGPAANGIKNSARIIVFSTYMCAIHPRMFRS